MSCKKLIPTVFTTYPLFKDWQSLREQNVKKPENPLLTDTVQTELSQLQLLFRYVTENK